jgi:hypothetical protein
MVPVWDIVVSWVSHRSLASHCRLQVIIRERASEYVRRVFVCRVGTPWGGMICICLARRHPFGQDSDVTQEGSMSAVKHTRTRATAPRRSNSVARVAGKGKHRSHVGSREVQELENGKSGG